MKLAGLPTPSTQASTNVYHIQLRVFIVFQVSPINMKIRQDKVRDYLKCHHLDQSEANMQCHSLYHPQQFNITLAIHYNVHYDVHCSFVIKLNYTKDIFCLISTSNTHTIYLGVLGQSSSPRLKIVLINPLINHQ
jgi:hypothetical protein